MAVSVRGQQAPAIGQTPAVRQAEQDKPFVHPGLLHTEDDFQRMRAKVEAGEQPWLDGWNRLTASRHAQLNWNPRPTREIVRGGGGRYGRENYPVLFNDIHAAYQHALRWKLGGDTDHADKAVQILNAWSSTLEKITGDSNACLAAGIYGYQFANAAEIMRAYDGWAADDFDRFKTMMLEVFYPINHDFLVRHNGTVDSHYWANWDLCNIASIQAIGVLCDRRDLYDEALAYCYHGAGNGALDKAIYYLHPGYLGQWQESGRDQGHSTLGVALMGPICETAWNQGDDLYGYDNNRFLAGAEYVARYNLGEDVPYEKYAWGLGQRGDRREQPQIASHDRGSMRHGYELVVNHYVNRLGIAAPYSERYAERLRPEGGGGGHASSFDQLGLGTLTDTLDPQVQDPRPTGLTAIKQGGSVVLSWWGAAGADRYSVRRATQPGGPYNTIAVDIRGLHTYTDDRTRPGTNYYIVTATARGRRPAHSDEAAVTTEPTLRTRLTFDREERGDDESAVWRNGAARSEGRSGDAASLDGEDDYLALPAGIVDGLGDFTITTWVYLNQDQAFARVFDFGDDQGRSMFLTPRTRDGKARFAFAMNDWYRQQVIDADTALPTGRWVHVAVTRSGNLGTLYIDGKPVGRNDDFRFAPFQLGSSPNNWVGRSQYDADPYLDGKVDDLRVYDGALSAEQVKAIADGP